MPAAFGWFRVAVVCSALAMLSGCAGNMSTLPRTAAGSNALMSGSVHGGQQPVVGATIQLYAVGLAGDGSAATPLLTVPVTTGAGGTFYISNDYSCGSATEVYLTATGGNPGLGSGLSNPNLALMTALGPCSSLTASTFISVNELTTVAATAALYPYSSSLSAIGSGPADASSLASAFSLAGAFVDPSTGATPGSGVPAGMSVPSAELNTLADILSACINLPGGQSGDGTLCGSLFSATTVGGVAPTDTITALLHVAKYPSANPSQLYAMAPAAGPFQPVLTSAPASFAVQLQAMSAASALTVNPASIVFVQSAVGFASQPETVTLTNTGATAVTLSGIAVSGTNSSDFAQTNTCGISVAAGASCTVSVIFTPGASGSRAGTLTVTSSASGLPQSVSLSGVGGTANAGPVSLSVSSLSWGTAYLWQDFQVQNYGTKPLTIRGITSSSTSFRVVANGCGTQVPAQSVCTVSIESLGFTFNGSNAQYAGYSGTITVDDDASAGAQTLAVSSQNSSSASATSSFGA